MAFNGGDVFEINFNHPTIGTGTFFMKAGEDVTFDPGGFRTEDDMGSVAGNGEMIQKVNQMRWMIEGPIAWDMNGNNEIAVLASLAEDPVLATYTISHINNTVWRGEGKPVGDIQGSGQDATIPTKFSGGRGMVKII